MSYTNTIDESNVELGQRSKGQLWAGYIIGALPVLFLLMEELVWRNLLQFHAGLLGIIVVALVLFLPHGLRGAGWAKLRWRQRTGEAAP